MSNSQSSKSNYLSTKTSIVRIVVAFTTYFATIIIFGLVISKISTPNVLTILPNQVPQIFAILFVLISLTVLLDSEMVDYGLQFNRIWILDIVGGIIIGVIFQVISTIALIYVGDGTILNSWTTGVFNNYLNIGLALVTTALGYLVVAIGEDLLFRGVLIRELTDTFRYFDVTRKRSTVIAIVVSSLLFSLVHFGSGAEGLSTSVVILQAFVGGIYFGVAYALTNSLATPIGIHLSTNIWTTVVFGQPESGYPAVFYT